MRTWSKRGVTPILQHQFNWDNLSIAAGVTLWQFYFRTYEGSMGKEEILDFLRHLNKQIVVDPNFWTQKEAFLRWRAALKNKESQCLKPERITRRA